MPIARGRTAVVAASFVAPLVLAMASCSSFSETSPPDAAADDLDAGDAGDVGDVTRGPVDGAGPSDGASGDAPGAPNLLPLGDFEHGGCSGDGYYSTLTPDSTAHGGTVSCRICASGNGMDVFSLDDDIENVTPLAGSRYVAEAWVRSAPGATAPTSGVEVVLRTHTVSPFTVYDVATAVDSPIDATWKKVAVTLDVTDAGAPRLAIVIDASYQSGACFLVDDVVVQQAH